MSRIPADPDFEPRIADWLEDDPNLAPGTVLGTVLAAFPSIPQRRASRMPWRLPTMNRLALVAAVAALAALVGLGVLGVGSKPSTPPAPTQASGVAVPSPSPSAAPQATPDVSPLGGRILVEHFGSAPDGSAPVDDTASIHRLYLADPNNMTGSGMTELLPGQPPTGKLSADVSPDSTQVVFEDWADPSSVYIVGIDGTGFRKVTPDGCDCSEWDPAFDPSGTRIVYGHSKGGRAWLEIRDLATGKTTKLPTTEGLADDAVPEAPSWSPDGSRIAFVRLTWNGVEATMGRVHYHTGAPDADVLSIVKVADGTVTDLPTAGQLPGDPDWSPDGSLILFTRSPGTIFDDGTASRPMFTIRPDGTAMTRLAARNGQATVLLDGMSAHWTPDGRILSTINFFTLVRPDGTGYRKVDPTGTDNTEYNVGFIYVGHWVGTP